MEKIRENSVYINIYFPFRKTVSEQGKSKKGANALHLFNTFPFLFTKAKGEKNEMEFFMDMIPPTATHQQQGHIVDRHGVHHFYRRADGETEAKLIAYLSKHIPEQPFIGAVQVTVKWCFPLKAKHKNGEPYTNKPDVDNLCKSLFDIMTKLHYWKDDKQIYSCVVEKFWAERPGIYIKIMES